MQQSSASVPVKKKAMAINNEPSLKSRTSLSRLKLAGYIVLRSGTIGLISGSVLGGLFGLTLLAFIWTGAIGAGLGLGLGLVNGLLLSVTTCLFFYPLKYVRLYHGVVKFISASIAAGGAAAFAPWYFSSTPMTPSSAVFIGFNSVLASIVAGWAGGLAGQNIAQWYEQKSAVDTQELARRISRITITLNKPARHLAAISLAEKLGWISVALFSLLCPLLGKGLLKSLVCGDLDVISCLPSPRLYTSVIEGFKVAIPIVFSIMLIVSVLGSRRRA
ncbi:hypothetical protein H6F95_04210 [Cyanobacteria bacterium FACHB-471]|nr:hypothetical protein [Cyanobacteria bacterium FACHB-471]